MGSKPSYRSGICHLRDNCSSSCFSVHTRAFWCLISTTTSSSNLEAAYSTVYAQVNDSKHLAGSINQAMQCIETVQKTEL